MGKIKKIIKKKLFEICPPHIADDFYAHKYQGYNNISFSQEGEDLVIDRFLEKKKYGLYVDIGAHHPIRYSNTYKFYLRGWRGVNIDAMPGSMIPFNNLRPNDINLEYAISDTPQKMTFYIFNGPELNTFSEEDAKFRHNDKNEFDGCYIIDEKKIQTHTLAEVLDEHFPSGETIDFMNIDVEGLDLEVLKSNNWDKYNPRMILAESLSSRFNFADMENDKIHSFLDEKGYKLVAKTYNTLFFLKNE